ncbi:hypothetical protein ACWCQL_13805 [Streptomyces sp. NPDC002073]
MCTTDDPGGPDKGSRRLRVALVVLPLLTAVLPLVDRLLGK